MKMRIRYVSAWLAIPVLLTLLISDEPILSVGLLRQDSPLLAVLSSARQTVSETMYLDALEPDHDEVADSVSSANARLYDELKSKNDELKKWTANIENRIDSGTKKILEKEAQYHALFDTINSGILVHDIDGNIVEANNAACKLFGLKKKNCFHSLN